MSKLIKMPKQTANAAAAFSGTNSKVGKQYPSKCKTGICYTEYVCDKVVKCAKCEKLEVQ